MKYLWPLCRNLKFGTQVYQGYEHYQTVFRKLSSKSGTTSNLDTLIRDFDNICILFTFKLNTENENLYYRFIESLWPYLNYVQIQSSRQGPPVSFENNSQHFQIKITIKNSSQEEHLTYSKAQNKDLKDSDFLCILYIKTNNQNLDPGCI